MNFKPGDRVKFPGLQVGKLDIKPVTGKLILADSNTSIPGVMRIDGDIQAMMFLPNGTIYCHSHFGPMLESVEDELAKEITAEELLAQGVCPCGSESSVGCSVAGCPLYLQSESK